MVSIMPVELPMVDLLCAKCRAEGPRLTETYTPYQKYDIKLQKNDIDEVVKVTVDVQKIRWRKLPAGHYSAEAVLSLACLTCEDVHNLTYHLAAPKVLIKNFGKCEDCGGEFSVVNEVLEYFANGENQPVLTINADLVCHNCESFHPRKAIVPFSEEPLSITEDQFKPLKGADNLGTAMPSLQRLITEEHLNNEASTYVLAFYEHIGRSCLTLGDLNWSETRLYLDQIPTDLARVDFLQKLAQLPDDGIVNNTIVDPATHNRITNTLLRPLRNECSRLLTRHFNLDNILKDAEKISAHADAIDFLWRVLRAFKKYHPGTLNGHYLPHELSFCKRIEDEIQYRKDVQGASGSSIHYSITLGENRGNIQQGGIGNSQSIGGQNNEIK